MKCFGISLVLYSTCSIFFLLLPHSPALALLCWWWKIMQVEAKRNEMFPLLVLPSRLVAAGLAAGGMWHVGQMKLNLQFNNTNYRDNNMRINNKLLAHSYRYLQQPNIRNTTTTPTNSLYTYSMLMPAIGISCSCYCPRLIWLCPLLTAFT